MAGRNKMRILSIIIFLFAFLLTVLITAPASLLDRGLQFFSQNRLLLANATGSIWRGSATPALRTREGHFVTLPFLQWKITLSSLFSGKIIAHLQWDNQPANAATEIVISMKQIELHHATLQLPARLLEESSVMLKPAQFRGQLQVQGEYLVLSNRGMEGNVIVDWKQASSAISSIAPLGDYHLTLNGSGAKINIGLSTLTGVLQLTGDGDWLAGRGLEFHGKAQASAGNQDNLRELLHHLGPELTPGVHAFNLTPGV
jgi:general secretion pathway protein N